MQKSSDCLASADFQVPLHQGSLFLWLRFSIKFGPLIRTTLAINLLIFSVHAMNSLRVMNSTWDISEIGTNIPLLILVCTLWVWELWNFLKLNKWIIVPLLFRYSSYQYLHLWAGVRRSQFVPFSSSVWGTNKKLGAYLEFPKKISIRGIKITDGDVRSFRDRQVSKNKSYSIENKVKFYFQL